MSAMNPEQTGATERTGDQVAALPTIPTDSGVAATDGAPVNSEAVPGVAAPSEGGAADHSDFQAQMEDEPGAHLVTTSDGPAQPDPNA